MVFNLNDGALNLNEDRNEKNCRLFGGLPKMFYLCGKIREDR